MLIVHPKPLAKKRAIGVSAVALIVVAVIKIGPAVWLFAKVLGLFAMFAAVILVAVFAGALDFGGSDAGLKRHRNPAGS